MILPGPTSTSATNAVEGTEITDFLKLTYNGGNIYLKWNRRTVSSAGPWESAGMLSGGSWVQIPAGSTTRVFKQTGETDDRVIGGGGGGGTLARWPCIFHPSQFH